MSGSLENPAFPQHSGGIALALAATGIAVSLYAIWGLGVSPAAALAISLLPLALWLSVLRHELALVGLTTMVAAQVSQNLSSAFGLPSTADLVVPGAVLILGLRYLVLRRAPFISGRALLALGSLLLWAGISILYARDWSTSQGTVVGMAKDLVLVFVIMAFIDSPRMLRLFLGTLIATFAAICLAGLGAYLWGLETDFAGFVGFAFVERRFIGPYPDANFFASFLVLVIPVCVARLLAKAPIWNRLLALLALVLLFGGLILTASRGGLLAVLLALPILLVFLGTRARFRALVIGISGAVLAAFALSDQLSQRFAFLVSPSVAAPTTDVSVEGRLASWEVALQLFRDHPLLGVGAGNFNVYYQDTALNLGLIFRGEGRSAHSLYLEALAEQGLVGLGLLLLVVVGAVFALFRLAARLAALGASTQAMDLRGFAVGLVAMLLARVFLHDDFSVLLWLAVGIGLAASRIHSDLGNGQAAFSPSTSR